MSVSSETNADNLPEPIKSWNDWNETPTRTPPGAFDNGRKVSGDLFNFYALWIDPATFFKQWCDATGETWMRMVGAIMNPQQWQAAHYQFIQAYMGMVRETFHLINEVTLQNMRAYAPSDISRLAKRVASLEERVYTIEEAFVALEDRDLNMATGQMVKGAPGDLEQGDGKQDTLNTCSSILEQTRVIGDLAGQLKRMEGKMDMLLAAFEKLETRMYPGSVWPDEIQKEHDVTQQDKNAE
jgi:hypothetical protein